MSFGGDRTKHYAIVEERVWECIHGYHPFKKHCDQPGYCIHGEQVRWPCLYCARDRAGCNVEDDWVKQYAGVLW